MIEKRTPPPPATSSSDRAARLPSPFEGRVVSVPIELWNEYKRLHGLEVAGARPDGALICKPTRGTSVTSDPPSGTSQ
jgi:hypothetical protein